MRTPPAHVAPPDQARKRRRLARVTLACAVVAALGGSGIYLAGAQAEEVAVPGRVQAEAFAAQSGAQTESTGDADGGRNVGWLANGDWLRYDGVSITGAELTARVAAHNTDGGAVELRLGTQTGTLLASFPVAHTGGWQKWTTVTARASSVPTGPQTVFAVMKSASRSDFVNLNWFTFGPATGTTPSASPTPSSGPATPTPGTPTAPGTPTTPPAAGWVPVDQAAWNQELAAFTAIKPKAVPPGTTRVPEFHTDCEVANSAPDDPIVLPGLSGASHLHTFFGPKVDAFTTTDKLLSSKTTCNAPGDLSAYWVPSLRNS
ncbi:carbohydrate-binding protein, partial [Micromonospora sp. NPDC049580]|uniref:carbohydrate-binding protein n=1 Tax=Micromonospora sp. NPDC049580 TaxID=3154832 RepID=UPI00344A929D